MTDPVKSQLINAGIITNYQGRVDDDDDDEMMRNTIRKLLANALVRCVCLRSLVAVNVAQYSKAYSQRSIMFNSEKVSSRRSTVSKIDCDVLVCACGFARCVAPSFLSHTEAQKNDLEQL